MQCNAAVQTALIPFPQKSRSQAELAMSDTFVSKLNFWIQQNMIMHVAMITNIDIIPTIIILKSEHNPDIFCNCHQRHQKVPANLVSARALVQLQQTNGQSVQGLFHFDSVPNVIAINVQLDTSAAAVHLYGAHNYFDTSAADDLEF